MRERGESKEGGRGRNGERGEEGGQGGYGRVRGREKIEKKEERGEGKRGREGGREGGRDVVEGMETDKRVVREEEGEERWGELMKGRPGVTRIAIVSLKLHCCLRIDCICVTYTYTPSPTSEMQFWLAFLAPLLLAPTRELS